MGKFCKKKKKLQPQHNLNSTQQKLGLTQLFGEILLTLLKVVTDRPIDRQTDIVLYRAAISAKKKTISHKNEK